MSSKKEQFKKAGELHGSSERSGASKERAKKERLSPIKPAGRILDNIRSSRQAEPEG